MLSAVLRCDFVILIAPDCYIGSFSSKDETSLIALASDQATVQVFSSKFLKAHFKRPLLNPLDAINYHQLSITEFILCEDLYQRYWHHHIVQKLDFTSNNALDSLNDCLAICLLTRFEQFHIDYDCDMAVFSTDICYLGSTRVYEGGLEAQETLPAGSMDVYVSQQSLNKLYTANVEAASTWTKLIYETILIPNPSVNMRVKCESLCLLDDRPCQLYVVEDPYCHLGDWNVNSNFVTSTAATTVYGHESELRFVQVYRILNILVTEQVGLLVGGEEHPILLTNSFGMIEGNSYCTAGTGLPYLPEGIRGHAMLYLDGHLLSCGGATNAVYRGKAVCLFT